MIKRILLVIGVLLPVIVIGSWLMQSDESAPTTMPTSFPDTNTTPINTANQMVLELATGASVVVPDITVGSDTFDDQTYVLTGIFERADPRYSISYYEPDDFFAISILADPLSDNRRLAEQELIQRLGISSTEACALNVHIGVPMEVSPLLAGEDLGLSFCPGSLEL